MFQFALLALFLGIKHSFDPDHLLAVSNLISKAQSVKKTLKMSVSWAAGHMLTAIIVTVILFTFKDAFLSFILGKMELAVALMLIILGLAGIYSSRVLHAHIHKHGKERHAHVHMHLQNGQSDHSHRHMFGIGIIHGLASNDELLMLLTVSLGLSSLFDMVFGVAIFTLGVVIGMAAFSFALTYPLLKARSAQLSQAVNFTVGCASVIYGCMMLLGI